MFSPWDHSALLQQLSFVILKKTSAVGRKKLIIERGNVRIPMILDINALNYPISHPLEKHTRGIRPKWWLISGLHGGMRGSGECRETVVDVENSTGRPEKAPKKRKRIIPGLLSLEGLNPCLSLSLQSSWFVHQPSDASWKLKTRMLPC